MERTISGIKPIYTITDTGIVYTVGISTKKELRVYVNEKGYLQCHVFRLDGTMLTTTVHRLVALAFIPNPDNKSQVNHKDTNKLNNNVDNLEWTTQIENMKHAVKNHVYTRFVDITAIDIATKNTLQFSYIKQAAEFINSTQGIVVHNAVSSISKCLRKQQNRKCAYGYYWNYAPGTEVTTD